MTLHEFNTLDIGEKVKAAMAGNLLGEREEEDMTVMLYSLDNFYVELFCHIGSEEVGMIHSFKSFDRLVPYLSHINFDIQQ